jgi:crossover junction endodeoxyribonuclease RuvC
MIIIGIDGGLSGGLVSLEDGKIQAMTVMPTMTIAGTSRREFLANEIVRWIVLNKPDKVIFEQAQAFPGQGVVSMFSTGYGYGMIRGILAARLIPYTIVHAKSWQKVMFDGLNKEDTKVTAAIVAAQLFPGADLRGSEKSKKPHEGIVDALLIAAYGYRTYRKEGTAHEEAAEEETSFAQT